MAGENVVVSTDRNRGVYSKALSRYPGLSLAPGFLRAEVALENGQNVLQFDLLRDNNGQNGKTENKLAFNDAFVISHIGLFLLADDTAAPGTRVLQSYPNETEFTLAGVTVQHLESFYNAKLQLTVGDKKEIPELNTRRFRSVPGIQQSAAGNESEGDYFRGMIESTPTIDLYGNSKIELQVTLPAFGGAQLQTTVAGRVVKGVLEVSGYLVQNGAKYKAGQAA